VENWKNNILQGKSTKKFKPRPKNSAKIHIMGSKGATAAVLFGGIMNASCYAAILEKGLLPFHCNKIFT